MSGIPPTWWAYAGMTLLVAGVAAGFAILALSKDGAVRRLWEKYEKALDVECRFMFYETTGARVARTQLLMLAGAIVVTLMLEEPILGALVPIIALAPLVVLRRRHAQRVLAIEQQLDSWLLLLANALKATPSLGEAISASARIVRPPIQQELDILLKEVQLGTPLDVAVQSMSARVDSRTVSSAMSTLLISRQTGGDLSRILEESAATLREMSRLEGVVRTKTAEGKSQAYVLGAIPFVLLGAIHMVDENWLRPLTQTFAGYVVIVIATLLWVAAIFSARKILAVDV